MTFKLIAAFLTVPFCAQAFSQAALVDSTTSESAIEATTIFLSALQNEKEIYNGPEHVAYLPIIEGTAYFDSKDWQMGSVQYYGLEYSNEALLYDLVKDRLIVRRPDGFSVELRSDKIDWFLLADHLFVYMNEGNGFGLKAGFYDRLATGAITLLAMRRKVYQDQVTEMRSHQRFIDETTYYAIQNNQVHLIRNLRSLLSLTGRKGGEIRQKLKSEGINFKENFEAALAGAARYYNQQQP